MHSFETNSSNVPAFLIKLWKLVEDPSCNDLIAWSDSGLSFIIKDQTRFSKELLPQYFKHNNMASFIRQLNMYGFRKVMNYEKSGLRNENEEMEFQHSFFAKDQLSLLAHIKRKIPNTKVSEPAVQSNGRDILTDLSSIREKQENMDNMLLKMKQENELLWRELTNMRKKHKAQEHVIQKVIQFLVSIVQRSNQNIGVQRKIPRMLHDGSGNQEKSQVSGTIDVLRNKNQNFITVPADKVISPLGPVIQEVNDFEHDLDFGTTSPCVKSPEDKTESSACHTTNQDSENQESDCPLISSLNSPINTSATMEPLSILEPLHPRNPTVNSDGVVEESVLGIPLEYISASPSNVISIPEEEPCDNIISLPDTNSDVAVTYSFGSSPNMLEYPNPSSKSDFEDPFLSSESLQTPKIPTIHIEDIVAPETQSTKKNDSLVKCTSKSKSGVQKQLEQQPQKKQQESEHNYQLSVPDSTDVVKSQSLTKNTFSNHVLSVEEELNSLYKQISSCGAWNIDDANKLLGVSSDDANKLLGLFSTDDAASNETLAGELAGQTAIKTEPVDIVGNELVHFTPSMLEVGLDYGNLECLIQDTNNPLEDLNKDSENQKNFLGDVLIDVDQATASEAAEFLLNNGSNNKLKSPSRPRIQKIQKAKRRKIK